MLVSVVIVTASEPSKVFEELIRLPKATSVSPIAINISKTFILVSSDGNYINNNVNGSIIQHYIVSFYNDRFILLD